MEYFGEAPGLTLDAAEYLITKNPKFVAVDMPYVDCPCATALTPHVGRPGPFMKRLVPIYKEKTGRDALEDYPGFYPAHKALAAANIPVIQQMAGDVDEVTGKRATMIATPWKIWRGDACVVRFVAIFDPSGKVRIDPAFDRQKGELRHECSDFRP
jgi:kynurenine formamidase